MKNYEKELPEGYSTVYKINAMNAKTGIIFNVISIAITILFVIAAFLTAPPFDFSDLDSLLLPILIFMFVTIIYLVLHELVHGIVYKAMTGQKLKFGMSWSCAYCGVPDIYVYRKTAINALIAPLIVFSIIFVGLAVAFWFIDPVYYLFTVSMLGLHLGGCSGDIYVTILFLTKFKDSKRSLYESF